MKQLSFNQDQLEQICRQNDIAFLGIFGSFARQEARKDSDIDILVRFSTKKSLLDLVRTERKLTELMGRKVDLLTELSISSYLRDKVKKQLQIIYGE